MTAHGSGPGVRSEAAGHPDAYVERFAAAMVASGMPRMAARVFALLLTRDDGAGTAADIGAALQASPAAVSGAVRYLIQVHLVTRSHRPGDRRDVYRLLSDHWYELLSDRERELEQWATLSREGVAEVGADTPAGRRLAETAEFFTFLRGAMTEVFDRWRRERG